MENEEDVKVIGNIVFYIMFVSPQPNKLSAYCLYIYIYIYIYICLQGLQKSLYTNCLSL